MSGTQDYPRLSNEARKQIVELLQASGCGAGHFDNLADQHGPYVVTGCFELRENGEREVIEGLGPVVVDTRDGSVHSYGSAPGSWPARPVKLTNEPFPAGG